MTVGHSPEGPALAQNVRGGMPSSTPSGIDVALCTGGFDPPYALGLAKALLAKGITLDFIGGDDVDGPELHGDRRVTFLNVHGSQRGDAGLVRRVSRILAVYARLLPYAWRPGPRIFHILWNNKLELFDRTLLMLYYKLRGKKIVLTAHNVNAARRDFTDSLLNRLTLKIQYRLVDHIFVHTDKMQRELIDDFGVSPRAITVIPFGINDAVEDTALTCGEARRRLGIEEGEKTVLFFGSIRPYKGLEYLVAAFREIAGRRADYRLIVAGEPKRGSETYMEEIRHALGRAGDPGRIIQRLEYIPDGETEVYFKAADVVVLPYTEVSQSGVLFLAYRFGLPAIAADVGSFREDIVEGRTGFVCKAADPLDLAKTIETYFDSRLFEQLDARRTEIQEYAATRHAWDIVGEATRTVYGRLLGHHGE